MQISFLRVASCEDRQTEGSRYQNVGGGRSVDVAGILQTQRGEGSRGRFIIGASAFGGLVASGVLLGGSWGFKSMLS